MAAGSPTRRCAPRSPALALLFLARGALGCPPGAFEAVRTDSRARDWLSGLRAQLKDPCVRTVNQSIVHVRLGDYDMGLLSEGRPLFRSNMEFSGAPDCMRDGIRDTLYSDSQHLYISMGMFFLCGSRSKSTGLFPTMQNFFAKMNSSGRAPNRTMYTNSFYLFAADSADAWRGLAEGKRPAVVVGPPHARKISCRWASTRAAFIPALLPAENRVCDANATARLRADILRQSRRFPEETVVFLMASGTWGRVLIAKLSIDEPELKKDVFFDVGSTVDAVGGKASRDYNRDWKRNCQRFSAALTCQDCELRCKHNLSLCAGCVPEAQVRDDCMHQSSPEPAAEAAPREHNERARQPLQPVDTFGQQEHAEQRRAGGPPAGAGHPCFLCRWWPTRLLCGSRPRPAVVVSLRGWRPRARC